MEIKACFHLARLVEDIIIIAAGIHGHGTEGYLSIGSKAGTVSLLSFVYARVCRGGEPRTAMIHPMTHRQLLLLLFAITADQTGGETVIVSRHEVYSAVCKASGSRSPRRTPPSRNPDSRSRYLCLLLHVKDRSILSTNSFR